MIRVQFSVSSCGTLFIFPCGYHKEDDLQNLRSSTNLVGEFSGIALTCLALSGSRLKLFPFPVFSYHLYISM